jgi:transglutaminase-like putative cysteine protease
VVLSLFGWFWERCRPAEGWLPVFLLAGIVAGLITAVAGARWVPESGVVVVTGTLAFILGVILAQHATAWWWAWGLHLAYAPVVTLLYLARFWPSPAAMAGGWETSAQHMRQNAALFGDRVGGWILAAWTGGSSQETIVFALGLGLATWLLVAYTTWSTLRQRRPLHGLTLAGLVLALNGYYGRAPLWPILFFTALAALLAAAIHFASLEREWQRRRVDYSDQIRIELLGYSGGIALLLMAVAFILPVIKPGAVSRWLLDRPAVHQAEETLDRVFGGVEPARPAYGVAGVEGDGAGVGGSASSLPRAHILGNPPELRDVVAMTAIVRPAGMPVVANWRNVSYDVYTGRGWAISTERQERLHPGAQLAAPAGVPVAASGQILEQSVTWVLDERTARYTLGLPLAFDRPVVAYWRGVDDLARVEGEGTGYRATSRVPAVDAGALRAVLVQAVPPALLARYTALPDDLPERVRRLADDVAGNLPTAYDQARALERFLRQYPYSLDVPLPPRTADPVDFFLFDLQEGYCDYYASAMVVMARSLGLPARLAVGYRAQPADDEGVQTIYELNAHSWPEIYFAGYGWVEFEPTAAFPTSANDQATGEPGPAATLDAGAPPPIPARTVSRPSPLWALGLLLLLLLGWFGWHRRPRAAVDGVLWAYGRLQRSARGIGEPARASQTPAEFAAALVTRLDQTGIWSGQPLPSDGLIAPLYQGLASLLQRGGNLPADATKLAELFARRQYARERPPAAGQTAIAIWARIRLRFWFLRWIKKNREWRE